MPDPKSIEAVTSFRSQTPRTVGDVIKKLISHPTEAPFLAFPQYDKPFAVHVDACEYDLGTALY